MGKSWFCRRLSSILPDSTWAKCGHGATKATSLCQYFTDEESFRTFIHQSNGQYKHLILESNSLILSDIEGIRVFIDCSGEPKCDCRMASGKLSRRKDAELLEKASDIIVKPEMSEESFYNLLQKMLINPEEGICETIAKSMEEVSLYHQNRQ